MDRVSKVSIRPQEIFKTLVKGYKIKRRLETFPKPPPREMRIPPVKVAPLSSPVTQPELPKIKPKKEEGIEEVERRRAEEAPSQPMEERVKEGRAQEKIPSEEESEAEGIELPTTITKTIEASVKLPEEKAAKIVMVYPLIPKKPSAKDLVFAYAKIFWNLKENRYVYHVVEPELTPRLKNVLEKVKHLLEQKIDIEFSKLAKAEAKEYLRKKMEEALNYFGFKLHPLERKILHYYAERDFIGLGKIEPLMRDPDIEEISCDGVGIPLFVFHRNPALGSVVTNIVFETSEELDSFVIRLSQLCGKSISVASPLLDGSLPDGSRVQATLATDIARKGSNFTIRKFTETPLTPTHLLKYNTLDVKVLAFLWLCVDYGLSMFVSGGTATGKTTFLNVLSLFIRPEKKIVSIEDTAELRLPHPHWVPQVARVPIATKPGEVDLFALLKESLRQRPDYIIVGEVRGPEAFVLFQQIATGHPSLATIHAEDMTKLVDRLITPPISLPPGLIENLDLVIFLVRTRYKDKIVRRVNEVVEIVGFDREKNFPRVNVLFKWNPSTDAFDVKSKSFCLRKLAERRGIPEKEITAELQRRMLVLKWVAENDVYDYRDVYKVINAYYTQPERVIEMIRQGME